MWPMRPIVKYSEPAQAGHEIFWRKKAGLERIYPQACFCYLLVCLSYEEWSAVTRRYVSLP